MGAGSYLQAAWPLTVAINPSVEIIEKVYVIQYVPYIILLNYKRCKTERRAHTQILVSSEAHEKYQV